LAVGSFCLLPSGDLAGFEPEAVRMNPPHFPLASRS
jgi:hypothetical protein